MSPFLLCAHTHTHTHTQTAWWSAAKFTMMIIHKKGTTLGVRQTLNIGDTSAYRSVGSHFTAPTQSVLVSNTVNIQNMVRLYVPRSAPVSATTHWHSARHCDMQPTARSRWCTTRTTDQQQQQMQSTERRCRAPSTQRTGWLTATSERRPARPRSSRHSPGSATAVVARRQPTPPERRRRPVKADTDRRTENVHISTTSTFGFLFNPSIFPGSLQVRASGSLEGPPQKTSWCEIVYRLDVLHVTQPAASKHWRMHVDVEHNDHNKFHKDMFITWVILHNKQTKAQTERNA